MKQKLGRLLMRLFGKKGNDFPNNPNYHATYKWHPYEEETDHYECCILNSESPSDQVWLGCKNRWYHFYSGPEFRKMAIWVLWRWVWSDWCGLKTKLWLIGLRLV